MSSVRRRGEYARSASTPYGTMGRQRQRRVKHARGDATNRPQRLILWKAISEEIAFRSEQILGLFVLAPAALTIRVIRDLLFSPTSHRIVIRASLLTILHLMCIFVAIVAYVGFYNVWVPHNTMTRVVNLEYGCVPWTATVLTSASSSRPTRLWRFTTATPTCLFGAPRSPRQCSRWIRSTTSGLS